MDLRNVINWEIPEGVVVKVTDSNGVVIWNKGNNEPDLPTPLANEIYYTSTDGNIVELSSDYSGVQPISNTYENGIGKMVFENDLTKIEDYTFKGCYKLTRVKLPSSIKTIGYQAFYACCALSSIQLPNSVTTIGNYAFAYCEILSSIQLPNSVTTIGNDAFFACYALSSIQLPNSVTTIGNHAFALCKILSSIQLPNSVTTIGNGVFRECYSLQSIVIPNSVTIIGEEAFRNCTSLRSITCKAMQAPELYDTYNNIFENVGKNIQGEKILYVPQGSTGYDTWLSQLEGFELQYITE